MEFNAYVTEVATNENGVPEVTLAFGDDLASPEVPGIVNFECEPAEAKQFEKRMYRKFRVTLQEIRE